MLTIIYCWGNIKLLSLPPFPFTKDTLLAKVLTLSTVNMDGALKHLGILAYANDTIPVTVLDRTTF